MWAEAGGEDRGHRLWDSVLSTHVADGRVDYARLKAEPRLARYLDWLAATRPDSLGSHSPTG